ncbi:hypothetical protein T03_5450 [Trichinella britovi]|uniref:Uncharacterized protein n=1 Tax=Trichinella britovi TaxID=45882 RepID=A0A0V1DEP1_TRIBR|nr:hypothetical protein T03_5450 [Trichinella britovi]
MALRSAHTGCNTPRFWSVNSPGDFMMKTTDFTVKKCVFYDASALKNQRLVAVSSLQLNRQLKIPSLHWSRLSDTNRTDPVPIRLVFRISRLWIHAVIETAMLYEKCTAMALRSAQTGCNTPRFWSVHSPGDFMMKTTDFTQSPLFKILSLHWNRQSNTGNTNCCTGTMPPPGVRWKIELFCVICLSNYYRTDAVPIRLVFRISRLWIHAVIETAMLYEKCTAMALRSAQRGCNTPRLLSLSSPVDFMMKTTDFTVKKCVFYDPSALKNQRLVAVSSLQLNR